MPHIVSYIFLLPLIFGAECALDAHLKADFFSIYKHVAVDTRDLEDEPVTPEKVTYYLFTKDSPDDYVTLTQSKLNLLDNKKIVFFIHGWTNSREVEWYEGLKNAFLVSYDDYYVVQVDWKEPARQYYYVSSINTYDVAKFIADLIVDLNKNHNVNLNNVLLVGHSLGGQMTGFVGKHIYKMTGRKLPRIVALDPAGPLFVERPDDKRLNKDDAEIVEVIHTDGGTFGFKDATGTIDFFPNGGKSQPGCKTIDLLDPKSLTDPIPCDHMRAPEYFIEAVLNPKEFVATKCADWESYKDYKCQEEQVTIGNLTIKTTGNFYLETNKNKPFAKRRSKSDGIRDQLFNIFQP